jgi:hypothetical protein
MTEFKVGDRVKYKDKYKLDFYYIKYIDCPYVVLKDYENSFYELCSSLELVERKVGEHWFKPHELYIHENALPPREENLMKYSITLTDKNINIFHKGKFKIESTNELLTITYEE